MSTPDRKVCFECGLDLVTGRKVYNENLRTDTVVGGWISIYLCSKECRDQHLLITKEMVNDIYH